MHIKTETLDDALLELYPSLLAQGRPNAATRGKTTELVGVLIEIEDARARLSRSQSRGRIFSALGELLWYLKGSDSLDFIRPYIPRYENEADGGKIYGAYGPRLLNFRGNNQIENVVSLLSQRPASRRAMIQIFDSDDIAVSRREIPCTATLQFLVRNEAVHLIATMRSNDAYIGLPHDVFCFTMIQEIIARRLGRDLGTYRHFVGSMHLYEEGIKEADDLVRERYQSRIAMPAMPNGDPRPAIKAILESEEIIRAGCALDLDRLQIEPYWADIIRLLKSYFSRDPAEIRYLREKMAFAKYRMYIDSRLDRLNAGLN